MEEVVHAFKSPYSNGYVTMVVPSGLTVDQLQEVVKLARQMSADLAGATSVPQSFSNYPINRVGRAALTLISSTMPDRLADGIEGAILLNMMAAFKFMRQLLDRVAGKVPMKRDEYISGIVSYCNRFSPHFTDALKLRLPVLVKQSLETRPPMPELSQRLNRLVDIALSTVSSLRDIIGDDSYERWLERKTSPRSPPMRAEDPPESSKKEDDRDDDDDDDAQEGSGNTVDEKKEEEENKEEATSKSYGGKKDEDEQEKEEKEEEEDFEEDISIEKEAKNKTATATKEKKKKKIKVDDDEKPLPPVPHNSPSSETESKVVGDDNSDDYDDDLLDENEFDIGLEEEEEEEEDSD